MASLTSQFDWMSFVRRVQATSSLSRAPKGCYSTTSETLVLNTGVPSFDKLFTSGIPLGVTLSIREDWPRSSVNYSSSLLKCIISEGLQTGQFVLYIDGVDSDMPLSATLPSPIKNEDNRLDSSRSPPQDEKMTIAWRYKHLRSLEDEPSNEPKLKQQEHIYDLGKKLTISDMANLHSMTTFDGSDKILEQVGNFSEKAKADGSILRIIIRSFGSPLHPPQFWSCLLYKIRHLMANNRTSMVLFLSIPAYSYQACPERLADFESQCDAVVEMQSFIGTPQENVRALNEYSGFLRLVKPLRIPGSLALCLPETNDLAFKLKRRQLYIEPFHMPPALDDSALRPALSSSGCSALETNKLDF